MVLWPIRVDGDQDRFEIVKKQLTEAACTRIEFLSIIESDIFDLVDTAEGSAYLARDGRFRVAVGMDLYLYDLQRLYSYSSENNQVVIEDVTGGADVGKEVSFIVHFDELYETRVIEAGRSYQLVKKSDRATDTPDSLTVYLAPDTLVLERLEYLDVNEEPNVIIILHQGTDTRCEDSQFQPRFPDSVETVRL